MEAREYDYIIIGAGAAGLMLAASMGEDEFFKDKSILLLERQEVRTNDRTWSFWEKGKGEYDDILIKEWSKIGFKDADNTLVRDITPYKYKTLRGLDFYRYQDDKIKAFSHITRECCEVKEIIESGSEVQVRTEKEVYRAQYVFSSAMMQNPNMKVLILNGYYDIATVFYGVEYTIDHLGLPPNIKDNIIMKYYEAGHMMYTHQPSLVKFKQDVAEFIVNTSK